MPNPCRYAIVEQVQIETVNEADATITFATRADDGELRSFTVARAEILADGPTAVRLVPGQVGDLYLSRAGWAVTSAGGHRILGAGNEAAMDFKWPQCAGAMVYYSPQKVNPREIRITGRVRGTDTQIQHLEIWNQGETAQEIHWNGAEHLRLQLRPGMVDGLSGAVEVWPTSIVVKGTPEAMPEILLEVELLDRMLARATQDLVWTSPSGAVTLHLTPEGCATCGLLSDAISALHTQLGILERARPGIEVRGAPREITILGLPAGPDAVEPNDFLTKVLEKVSHPGMREVYRASSILEIQQRLLQILAPNPDAKISLQLVSHASSGILWLGRYGDAPDASPFHYLDMDPDSLAFLAQFGRNRNLSDVRVVGCDVGSASHVGNAYNGRTLMYTLAELFRCRVVGATDAVHHDEFDERGTYRPDLLVHSGPAGWQWYPDREPVRIPSEPAAPQPDAQPDRSFLLTRIQGTRAHVQGPDQPFELPEPLGLACKEDQDPALRYLAPEFSVTVRPNRSAAEYQAAILRGGRFLRIEGAHYRIARGDELGRFLVRPSGAPRPRPVLPIVRPHDSDSTPPPLRNPRRIAS